MGFWRKFLKRHFNNQKGQSVTEYILILSIVVLIAIKFKEQIGDKIKKATDTVGDNINSVLEINN